MRIFGADVDVAFGRADGDAGDRHSLDQNERITFHDHAVGESAAVAFVGIANDVFPVGFGLGDGLPLDAGRKSGAAAAAQAGLRDVLNDTRRIRQRFGQSLAAAMGLIIFKRARIDDAATRKGQSRLLLHERMIFRHADAQFVIGAVIDHRAEHTVDVGKLDRSVSNAALRGRDFRHRFEPMHAARAVSDNPDGDFALRCQGLERCRDLVRAACDSRRVTGHVDAKRAHRSVSARSASSFFSSRRATIRPSSMAEGDTEQRPRQ